MDELVTAGAMTKREYQLWVGMKRIEAIGFFTAGRI